MTRPLREANIRVRSSRSRSWSAVMFRRESGSSPASPPSASLSAACSRSVSRSATAGSGNWSPRVTSAVLALMGFIAIYAVPILKYPANPPAIGNPDTIGLRTAIYFGMILLSLGAMIAAWNVRNRLIAQHRRLERDADRRRRLCCRGGRLRACDATARRDPRGLPGRRAVAVPHGVARRAGDHLDGARARFWRVGPARFRRGEGRAGCSQPTRPAKARGGLVTARLDLMAHGASEATRAARFPDDEALEASAIRALEALRGRLGPYAHVLTAPARAARETAAGARSRRGSRAGAEGLRLWALARPCARRTSRVANRRRSPHGSAIRPPRRTAANRSRR